MRYNKEMIARYTLFEIENLRDRFHLASGVPGGTKQNYNISPTNSAPVVVLRDGKPELEQKKWGFISQNAKDSNSVFRYKTHAVRSEVIFAKPTWEKAIRTQRCLIPTNGFYEWHETEHGKTPYLIQLRDQTLFAMAGVYSSWTDPAGKEWGTYCAVTIDSHSSKLHTKVVRPIILDIDDEATWLDTTITDTNTLYSIMKTYPDDILSITKVGDAINSTKASGSHLIQPAA